MSTPTPVQYALNRAAGDMLDALRAIIERAKSGPVFASDPELFAARSAVAATCKALAAKQQATDDYVDACEAENDENLRRHGY
jgi:hypothetical protein